MIILVPVHSQDRPHQTGPCLWIRGASIVHRPQEPYKHLSLTWVEVRTCQQPHTCSPSWSSENIHNHTWSRASGLHLMPSAGLQRDIISIGSASSTRWSPRVNRNSLLIKSQLISEIVKYNQIIRHILSSYYLLFEEE